jgi:hypothetical protein
MIWILIQTLIFKMMKELINFVKMFLAITTVILAYVFAGMGAVELFWNTDDSEKFQARVIFISLLLFIVNVFILIASYNIMGDEGSTGIYNLVIYSNLIYLILGNIYFFFIRKAHE